MTTENVTIERHATVVNIQDISYAKEEATIVTFRVFGITDSLQIRWAKDQPIPSIRAQYVFTLTPRDDAP